MSDPRKPFGPQDLPAPRDADFQDPALHALAEGPQAPLRIKHPAGLRVLFATEMWERFSFYGMKALLILYLTKPLAQGGREWTTESAGKLMAWYGGLVYLSPIIGGYLADRWLGTHRSLIIGGLIIAAGHFTLAADTLPTLFAGLSLVIIGTGFFKSNVSTMVGQLYHPGDPRRDAGFTVFYMGINLGAFLAPLVCGWLRTTFGWRWGFAAAGVGMVLGIVQYLHGKPRHLAGIGDPPPGPRDYRPLYLGLAGIAVLGLVALGLGLHDRFASLRQAWETFTSNRALFTGVSAAAATAVLGAILLFINAQKRDDRGPVAVIFIMSFFVLAFWTAFEQSGTSMALFADQHVDRTLPAWLQWAAGEHGEAGTSGPRRFPAEWFQSVNPLCILALAPVFASMWLRLARLRREPSTPVKMGLGLVLLGVGFLFMVGAGIAARGGDAAPWWLVAAFFVHTCGELCLSPVGLSLVTKLAPLRFASLLMGVWFLANFGGNFLAGQCAARFDYFERSGFILDGHAGFFLIFVLAPIGAGLIVLALAPVLKKLMRGRA